MFLWHVPHLPKNGFLPSNSSIIFPHWAKARETLEKKPNTGGRFYSKP